jgi:hypothetical protein
MRRIALLLVLLPLAACSQAEPLSLTLRTEDPDLQPVHNTLYSNVREPRRLLIQDAETWARVWAEMISMGDPRIPPYVDFAREDVIVAAMGERRASGYSIAVTGVVVGANETQVVVVSTVPGPICDGAEIMTAPLAAARIRKSAAPITFDERTAVRTCD